MTLESHGADGERRHATVVISDLSGYTALNERLDPEEVEEIMTRVKMAARKAIEQQGGIINQFIGDEVIGLFGIPIARRDDTKRAVRAALDLHRAVDALSKEFAPRLGRNIQMHSGINTGLVLARESDSREGRYLLTGDTINTAARLLTLAADGEIIAGQDTWREIADGFEAQERPATEVKGKEKPVIPWLIVKERGTEQKTPRTLCGRQAECDRFESLASDCMNRGRGTAVIVRGEAGIGKTRLGSELVRRATALGFVHHRALVLDFRAERGGDAIRTLARGLAATAPPPQTAPEQRIFLADLLDHELPADLRPLAAVMTEEVRSRGTREALGKLARDAAMRAPLLLLVEDIHWADDWVVDHLAELAAATHGAPLLLLMTTRPEGDQVARLAAMHATEFIDLEPLALGDMRRFAVQFEGVTPEVAQHLVERAGGNPLYLEQLLLNAGEQTQDELPGSIQGLVQARLDRLTGHDRVALLAAAVLGQRFSLETLRWLLDDRQFDCRGLLDHCLVRPDGDGFLFWHALIRDGAYAALLKSRRRQLHARAADWYRDRDPTVAAEHLERAGDPLAADAFLHAGKVEANRFRYEQALYLVGRGTALARTESQAYRLSVARAGLLLEMGRGHDALAAWRETLDLAATDADRCRAHLGCAAAMRLVDMATDGFTALEHAEQMAVGPEMALERSRLHHLRGNLFFGLGRVDECLHEHQAALTEARTAGSLEAEADALGGLGDAYYIRGQMRSAYMQFGRCVELARSCGSGRIEVANLHMLGWTAHTLARMRDARNIAQECLDKAQAVSHRRVEVLAHTMAAYIEGWIMGEVGSSQAHLEAALKIAMEMGARRFEGQIRTYRAQLACRAGDRALALALAREALAFCRSHGMAFFGPVALGLVGRLSPSRDEMTGCFAEAVSLLDAGAISHCHFEFHAHAIESALERHDGDAAEQYCLLLERYTAMDPPELMTFQINRGRALAAWGRGHRSAELRAQLEALRTEAATMELNLWLAGLNTALLQW